MELGISGKKAIVCAASKGLGRGCAEALAGEGVDLVICARGEETLEATALAIRKNTGVEVRTVACDVTTEVGRESLLAACPDPDILINNAGGPPPGEFKDFTLDDWRKAVEANMLSPIALTQSVVYSMMERGFGRIVNITSAAVKAPINLLDLSNGARMGLTGGVAIVARNASRHNVTINGLLPGTFETDRLRQNLAKNAEVRNITPEQAAADRISMIPARRFGKTEEFGAICAFLCSVHAGYLTAQNIVVDGGAFPGAL